MEPFYYFKLGTSSAFWSSTLTAPLTLLVAESIFVVVESTKVSTFSVTSVVVESTVASTLSVASLQETKAIEVIIKENAIFYIIYNLFLCYNFDY